MTKIKEMHGNDDIVQSFVIIQNRAAIALEVSNLLLNHFVPVSMPTSPEMQIQRRLAYIFRDILFVGTLSTIEFHLRNALENSPKTYVSVIEALMDRRINEPRKIAFRSIVKKLLEEDLIESIELWDFCITLRNDIVHNDSIGQKELKCPDMDYPIIVKKGFEAMATLRSFVEITQLMESSYFTITTKLLAL